MVYIEMSKGQQQSCDNYAIEIIAHKLEQVAKELDDEYLQRLKSNEELDEHDEAIYRAYEFIECLNQHDRTKLGWYLKDLYEGMML